MLVYGKRIIGIVSALLLMAAPLCAEAPTIFHEHTEIGVGKNLEQVAKKFLKPIYKLEGCKDINKIAKTVARFKVDMDKYFGSWISTKMAWKLVLNELALNAIPIHKKQLKKLIRKIDKNISKIESPWWMPKIPFLEVDQESTEWLTQDALDDAFFDLPPEAMMGCVYVFCGVIICALPLPGTTPFGAGVILTGVTQTMNATAIRNEE